MATNTELMETELMEQAPAALSALALPSQHARLIQLEAPLPGLVVERFTGEEAVCGAFAFAIDVLATSAFLDPAALLARPLTLRLRLADGGQRTWGGLCTAVAPLGGDGGLARYRLTLAPWTALLEHRRDARIFEDSDVRGVLEQVFAAYPEAQYRFDVTRPLPVRPLVIQYRERDWDFVTRLLAEAGLAWRFAPSETTPGSGTRAPGPGEDTAAGATLVIFDTQADVPQGGALRFHRAEAGDPDDALTAFAQQRQVRPQRSTVGSWQTEQVASRLGQAEAAADGGPPLEVYVQPRAGRFAHAADAQVAAAHRLEALRVAAVQYAGAGSARRLAAGVAFTLTQHAQSAGAAFVPLRVVHVAVNNLGAGIAPLLDCPALAHGSYRNRFVAVPAGTPLVPRPRDRPRVYGPQTARVVARPEAAVTASREHAVPVRFPWQRETDPATPWVPVAEWLAGPNWGSHFLPRHDAEVLVEFLHGDLDAPRITGQLYHAEAPLPFAGGFDGPANHPGTLSGVHSQAHDGSGSQQWVLDDTPGQLRTRLHTSLAESRLELGYLIAHGDHHRGGYRGQGLELATQGWGNVHAGQGLLLSATARPQGASTQLDLAEAVAQLRGAERTAQALHDTLTQQQVPGLAGNARLSALREAVDPQADGRFPGPVDGQPAMQPAPGGRAPGAAPVARFAQPVLIAEAPEALAWATPQSAVASAGGVLHLTAQADAHLASARTLAGVSGRPLALAAHAGPLRAIAAQGPLSLQAHAGALELLADQSVTVTASDDRLDVLAQHKLVLQAGQSTVTLEGGNITFATPGEFIVRASQQPFWGGECNAAELAALPDSAVKLDHWIEIDHRDAENEPFAGQAYKIFFAGGQIISGKLDDNGHARHENVPEKAERVEYEDPEPLHDKPWEPISKLVAAARSKLG